jgi:hypothetical protein
MTPSLCAIGLKTFTIESFFANFFPFFYPGTSCFGVSLVRNPIMAVEPINFDEKFRLKQGGVL